VLLGLPMENSKLEERAKLVEFIQSTLRALVSFYLNRVLLGIPEREPQN
jgi:hypothetical protein